MSVELNKEHRVWLVSGEIMSQLGGGHRQQRWCELFLDRGMTVLVFFAQGFRTFAMAEAKTSSELRMLRQKWIADSKVRAGVRTGVVASCARWMKHLLLIDLFLPSQWRLYRQLARRLVASPHRVALLCSSPPFALAVVCALIKRRYRERVFFALDMRDLWSLHTAHPGPRWHKRLIERWVLAQTDLVSTVSEGLSRRLLDAFGSSAAVAYNVATHVDGASPSDSEDFRWSSLNPLLSESTLKFVYTGSLPDGYYDLESFASALHRGRTQLKEKQFVFVGACKPLKVLARRMSLPEDLIVFVDQVNIATAQRIQRAADALIFFGFIASDNQGQVSIKLFEYMRQRKPILPLNVKPDSDIDVLLKLYCGRSCFLASPAEIAGALSAPMTRCLATLPVPKNSEADALLLKQYDTLALTIIEQLSMLPRLNKC